MSVVGPDKALSAESEQREMPAQERREVAGDERKRGRDCGSRRGPRGDWRDLDMRASEKRLGTRATHFGSRNARLVKAGRDKCRYQPCAGARGACM
jgi:hypothetical protein